MLGVSSILTKVVVHIHSVSILVFLLLNSLIRVHLLILIAQLSALHLIEGGTSSRLNVIIILLHRVLTALWLVN